MKESEKRKLIFREEEIMSRTGRAARCCCQACSDHVDGIERDENGRAVKSPGMIRV